MVKLWRCQVYLSSATKKKVRMIFKGINSNPARNNQIQWYSDLRAPKKYLAVWQKTWPMKKFWTLIISTNSLPKCLKEKMISLKLNLKPLRWNRNKTWPLKMQSTLSNWKVRPAILGEISNNIMISTPQSSQEVLRLISTTKINL